MYMAPEQAAGERVTAASDWYGVGALLYEALTGKLAFLGTAEEVLVAKQWFEPPPPRESAPEVPEDLDTLCVELLKKDPVRRPSGFALMQRLSGETPSAGDISFLRGAPFVGRADELAVLEEAWATTRSGRCRTVLLSGGSGIGKTALARRFLSHVARNEARAVVLTGRCYQQESVPYKAIDSLVDALSDWLKALPSEELDFLLPHDVLALARLFPVLQKVDAVRAASRQVLEIPDRQELRRRGFSSLRKLLSRLAAWRPLALFIDDLQWGDRDSAALLLELLRPPDAPPLLFLGAFRTEEAETSPLLLALRPALALTGELVEIPVDHLSPVEARQLVIRLLDPDDTVGRRMAEAIAAEAKGNPFFIDELVRYVRSSPERIELKGTPLPAMVLSRVASLPDEARRLLHSVAVAGKPIPLAVAKRAANVEADELKVLAHLKLGHLVKLRTRDDVEEIEIFSNRIRELALFPLSKEELVLEHFRLARAIEEETGADPEMLAIHYRGAGEPARAAQYVARAAEKAAEALAFDRAVRLYREALGLTSGSESWGLNVKLADALVNAGRGAEAAETYLLAVPGSTPSQALELTRRAGEQLLRSGHIDRGLEVLGPVLESMGLRLAETPVQALASLLRHRLRLKLRGLRWRERPVSEIPAEELVKIDTCWSVAVGLGIVDTVRGADFQARHMLLALEAGEPYRVVRALALECGYRATKGVSASRKTRRLLARAEIAARRVAVPHARGLVSLVTGISAALEGRWRSARQQLWGAETILRERCTGVAWELFNAQYFALLSLFYLGELKELAERFPSLLQEAEERGDLYAATSLSTRIAYSVHLAADRPDIARQGLERAMQRWSHQGFHMQHMWDLFGRSEIAMYEGKGALAHRQLLEGWPALERSMLLRIQLIRVGALHRRARAALAAAVEAPTEGERSACRREAERLTAHIETEGTVWGLPLARLLRAGLAALAGDRNASLALLVAAQAGFEEAEMGLYAAVTRWQRGHLTGPPDGTAHIGAAEGFLRAQEVKNIARTAAMLCPGFEKA